MEAETPEEVETIDQTHPSDDPATVEGWVSPEVQAAQAGQRVEMGKNIEDASEVTIEEE